MTTLRLATLIVTYNSASTIQDCLSALLRATQFASFDAEIVVHDNKSTDGTLSQLPRVQNLVVSSGSENLGFARGNNVAWEYVREPVDFVLLLNPDARLKPDTLEILRKASLDNPMVGQFAPTMRLASGVGVSGGSFPHLLFDLIKLCDPERALPGSLRQRVQQSFRPRYDPTAPVIPVDWVSGFCMLIRASVWKELRGMSERFFLYYEDVDFCRRAKIIGWHSAIVPAAECFHDESVSMGGSGHKRRQRVRGLLTYHSLYGNKLTRWVVPARTAPR